MATAESLIGAWKLVSWSIELGAGDEKRYPFGEHPVGSIMYSADGRMLAAIATGEREALSNAVPQRAPEHEKLAAFDSFFSYGGHFEVIGDDVVHHVDISLNPNFVGSTQVRRITLQGDQLELSASEVAGPQVRKHRLCWQRHVRED
jgi:hypothetical protein